MDMKQLVTWMKENPITNLGAYQSSAEHMMDYQLAEAAKREMVAKMTIARENGRHGWYDPNVISLDQLYFYRDEAVKDNDHVSILNYTAMIMAREAMGDK